MSGPGHGYARRFRSCVGFLADLEIPHRSADINHAGDAAANVAREHVVEMRFDPRDFVFVRANAVEIGAVRTREQISRLKEVNVCVDVARHNKFADATDLSPERGGVLFAHRDALNLVAVDHDRGIRQHFAIGRINHRRADERNFFGARGCG